MLHFRGVGFPLVSFSDTTFREIHGKSLSVHCWRPFSSFFIPWTFMLSTTNFQEILVFNFLRCDKFYENFNDSVWAQYRSTLNFVRTVFRKNTLCFEFYSYFSMNLSWASCPQRSTLFLKFVLRHCHIIVLTVYSVWNPIFYILPPKLLIPLIKNSLYRVKFLGGKNVFKVFCPQYRQERALFQFLFSY